MFGMDFKTNLGASRFITKYPLRLLYIWQSAILCYKLIIEMSVKSLSVCAGIQNTHSPP